MNKKIKLVFLRGGRNAKLNVVHEKVSSALIRKKPEFFAAKYIRLCRRLDIKNHLWRYLISRTRL